MPKFWYIWLKFMSHNFIAYNIQKKDARRLGIDIIPKHCLNQTTSQGGSTHLEMICEKGKTPCSLEWSHKTILPTKNWREILASRTFVTGFQSWVGSTLVLRL